MPAVRKSILFGVFLLAFFSSLAAQRQDALARQTAREEKEFQPAQNQWMRKAIDVRSQKDAIAQPLREDRDSFWDSVIGATAPLSEPGARSPGMWQVDSFAETPEFGNLDDGILVVGKFESLQDVPFSKRPVGLHRN
jgi:hypothetical protein